MSGFELDGGQHAKRGVPAVTVVEDLEVAEDLGGELDPGVPALAVEELDLHPRPERLDHRVGPRRQQHLIPKVMAELFG